MSNHWLKICTWNSQLAHEVPKAALPEVRGSKRCWVGVGVSGDDTVSPSRRSWANGALQRVSADLTLGGCRVLRLLHVLLLFLLQLLFLLSDLALHALGDFVTSDC